VRIKIKIKCITEKWVVSVGTESTPLGLISKLNFVSEYTNLGFIKAEKTVYISDTVLQMVPSSTWGGTKA